MGQITELAAKAHANAVQHGFWEKKHEFGTNIALIHSELSEALEADRLGNPPSGHIIDFSGIEEELADAIIRILDISAQAGYRIEEAVFAKMAYNETRPYKHGGKAF